MANLRIIYKNLVDSSTITASSTQNSTTTPATNLKSDIKSKVWRSSPNTASSTTSKGILLVDFGSLQNIGGVALAFTNFVSNAQVTVRGYTVMPTLSGTIAAPTLTGGTQSYVVASSTACPWNVLGLSNLGVGANTYAYGGGTTARVWLGDANRAIQVRGVSIEITDTYSAAATNLFVEVSRLIVGNYWSPVYNTSYGMTETIKDLSTTQRTEAGDLITKRGPRFSNLSFDLKWLAQSDRIEMTRILLGNGMTVPLFISLFPDDTIPEVERAHQIYGKITSIPGVSYSTWLTYSSQIDVEQV